MVLKGHYPKEKVLQKVTIMSFLRVVGAIELKV